METLIHWYELNAAEGHPDYRVIPVIKKALDGLWKYNWLPKAAHVRLQPLPRAAEPESGYTGLNNLVSVAYRVVLVADWRQPVSAIAETSCSSTPSTIPRLPAWSGKQFSQQFEFSFDYVRFRKGIDGSTVLPANNPYTGPYADTVPPISEKVNCDPN